MKPTPGRISLVIAISIFVLFCPVCSRYIGLTVIDLFSLDLNFENPDQDDQLTGQQHELDSLQSGISLELFLLQHNLMEQVFNSFSQVPSRVQESHVLRC